MTTATTYKFCPGSGARTPVVRDETADNEWHYALQPCPVCGTMLVPKQIGQVRKHSPR